MAAIEWNRSVEIVPGVRVCLLNVGHILGAAMASVDIQGKRILFTGDIGRPHDAIMQAPAMVKYADFLICESTYGDRRHDTADPGRKLADVVNRTIARGGSVIVPSFAVGRAQALMHLVERLKADGAIPPTLPV